MKIHLFLILSMFLSAGLLLSGASVFSKAGQAKAENANFAYGNMGEKIEPAPYGPLNEYSKKIIVYDFDNDGKKEIFIMHTVNSTLVLECRRSDNTKCAGQWPAAPSQVGNTPSFEIIPGKGLLYYTLINDNIRFAIYGFRGDLATNYTTIGQFATTIPRPVVYYPASAEGKFPQLVFVSPNAVSPSSVVSIYSADGQNLRNYPLPYVQASPSLGDINGDGLEEIIIESGMFWDNNIIIWAFNQNGLLNGWPKSAQGGSTFAGIPLADFNADGLPDAASYSSASLTRNYLNIMDYKGNAIFSTDQFNAYRNGPGGNPEFAICARRSQQIGGKKSLFLLSRTHFTLGLVEPSSANIKYAADDANASSYKILCFGTDGPSLQTGDFVIALVNSGNVRFYNSNLDLLGTAQGLGNTVEIADIDGDGYPDIASLNPATQQLELRYKVLGYPIVSEDWLHPKHDIRNSANFEYK